MSTQNPGSADGTQDQSIPIGLIALESVRHVISALGTTANVMQSLTRSVEQMAESLESYAVHLEQAMAQSTDTPRE